MLGEFIHIIAGVDGGKTAAIACIDLNGRIVRLETGRFVGVSWFAEIINETGVPVIIASDKQKPDNIAKRLSTMFHAILFAPKEDISSEKKTELAKGTRNLHERDALVAAKLAYFAYANKLNQASRHAKEHGADEDKVKALVIAKGYSIHEAITDKKAGRRK